MTIIAPWNIAFQIQTRKLESDKYSAFWREV